MQASNAHIQASIIDATVKGSHSLPVGGIRQACKASSSLAFAPVHVQDTYTCAELHCCVTQAKSNERMMSRAAGN